MQKTSTRKSFLITRYPSFTLLAASSKTSTSKPGMGHPTVHGLSGITGSTPGIAPPNRNQAQNQGKMGGDSIYYRQNTSPAGPTN
jgi:hypothetical protein